MAAAKPPRREDRQGSKVSRALAFLAIPPRRIGDLACWRFKIAPGRLPGATIAFATLFTAGCALLGQKQEKLEAQRNWNEVRARVKCQLARQQLESGAFDDALTSAQEAISLDATDPAAFVVATQAHIEKGDWTAAVRTIDTAERNRKADGRGASRTASNSGESSASSQAWAELLYLRGVTYERQGAFAEATANYHQAREMAPVAVHYLVAEVECLVADGHIDEAGQLLALEGEHYPADGTIDLLAAQIAQLLGDTGAAAAHLRSAMAHVDDDAGVSAQYGALLAKSGRHAEAVAVLQPLVEGKGAEAPPSVVRELASSLLALARYEQAHTLLLERVQA
ncbi:MAG TPA: hypothetical protein VGM03_15205, partial [Phycisphaerae bacterium]